MLGTSVFLVGFCWMWHFLWLGVGEAGRAPGPRYPPRPYHILVGAPVPPAEAAVTEPAASTHGQGLGGCGQGLPQPGALGAESLQPPQRPWLGAGGQLLAEAAAPQPVQLQSAHGAVECIGGCLWWGLAGPGPGQALSRRLPCRTLDSIGQACRQLRMVDVAMCPGISIASVRRFQAQLPEVTCIQSRFVGGADLTLTL